MYSIRRRFKTVRRYLDEVAADRAPSEALLSSTFVIEKILRRVLLQLMVSAGFSTQHALELCKSIRGVEAIKNHWKYFDPKGRSLVELVGGDDWRVIKGAAELRNALVHGSGHEQEKIYKRQIPRLLKSLDSIVVTFGSEYGYSGWKGFKHRQTSKLHVDPKVNL